jgi:hypothetical protein
VPMTCGVVVTSLHRAFYHVIFYFSRSNNKAFLRSCSNRYVSLLFSNIILSNSTLFTLGSIHQGHERFSDVSRRRQCSFMSFSALLCAQSLITSSTMDYRKNRPNNDRRRRQDVLKYSWKQSHPRCRDVIAELSACCGLLVYGDY